MIHAVVHTQGVVLGRTYFPLELAYQDALGTRAHLLITSPLPYAALRKLYPHSRPDVLVTTRGGIPYSQVLHFLRRRHQLLSTHFPSVVFGYKGESYQPQILNDAGIAPRVNIETFGIPALRKTHEACAWHRGSGPRKCARMALRQILQCAP